MKKLTIIITIMIGVACQSLAQNNAISKFFQKYEDDEEFTRVTITSRMFGLFTNMELEDEDDQEVLGAISKLDGLNILTKEDISNGKALYKEALSLIPKSEYDELMVIREKDSDMKFLIKEKNGKIQELLMLMGGSDEFFILSLIGEIDLKQVSKISKKMDIDGLEKLENMSDN